MSAHVSIEETPTGWLINEDDLDGKHVTVEFHGSGVDVDITDGSAPLNVSLGTPLINTGNVTKTEGN